MFILNKNTKAIQECRHDDVIKACRKDTKNYAVAETRAELECQGSQEPREEAESTQSGEITDQEQKADFKGDSESQGTNEEEKAAADDWENLSEEAKITALEAKKAEDLRKIAKDKGIQGYSNMNKDTLVAMIMNH